MYGDWAVSFSSLGSGNKSDLVCEKVLISLPTLPSFLLLLFWNELGRLKSFIFFSLLPYFIEFVFRIFELFASAWV